MDSWDNQLVKYGESLYEKRQKLVRELTPVFQKYYQQISGGQEEVELVYQSQLMKGSFLDQLRNSLQILKNDNKKIMIITPYQFLAPALNIYDNSPNQWHHPSVSFPIRGHKYFDRYKKYFIQNIEKNNIQFIYETIKDETTITELIIGKNCFKKNRINEILIKLELLKNCEDLK